MGWNTYQHMYIPLLQLFYNFPLTSLTQGISYTLFLFHISLAHYIWAQNNVLLQFHYVCAKLFVSDYIKSISSC